MKTLKGFKKYINKIITESMIKACAIKKTKNRFVPPISFNCRCSYIPISSIKPTNEDL